LRIAAKVAGERNMIAAYRNGKDLHTVTAQLVLGKADVTKADRQVAKSLNFGLLYGMGAAAFKAYSKTTYNVDLTDEQAKAYRDKFFESYPGLKRWHVKVGMTRSAPVDT